MPEPHWWPRFCDAVDRPGWVEDARFATYAARAANMPARTRLTGEVFATRPLTAWCALFDERGFVRGPASTVDEFAADGLFPEVAIPDGRRLRTVPHRCACRGALAELIAEGVIWPAAR